MTWKKPRNINKPILSGAKSTFTKYKDTNLSGSSVQWKIDWKMIYPCHGRPQEIYQGEGEHNEIKHEKKNMFYLETTKYVRIICDLFVNYYYGNLH